VASRRLVGFLGTAVALTGSLALATAPASASGYTVALTSQTSYRGVIQPVNQPVKLIATTNASVGRTIFSTTYIELYDTTDNLTVKSCYTGTTCTADVTNGVGGSIKYVAYVRSYRAGESLMTLATSNPQWVSWG
jgi:hypothetical protein